MIRYMSQIIKEKGKGVEHEIASMLKENTGTHFLDSGGAYGRHWEKNQAVEDFNAQPVLEVDYSSNSGISVTLNIFHFLTKTLDVTKQSRQLDKALQRFMNKKQYKEISYAEIIEDFKEQYLEPHGFKTSELDNTYNYDCMLSQVFTYSYIYDTLKGSEDYPEYILIQLHNGCDVRGGYTAPRIFEFNEFESFMSAQHDLDAYCDCTSLYSDDQGYHWYVDQQPELTQMDKMLGIEDRENDFERYKMPKYWEIREQEECIFCKCCKNNVEIQSRTIGVRA